MSRTSHENTNKMPLSRILILVLACAVFLFSGYQILAYFTENRSGEQLQQELIEKETDGTDHGKIASVIYNRLEGPGDKGGTYGMLQIDAALLYALPGHEGAITNSDKETDSPYNLYKKAGLPPTAIANPGLKAIDAALNPAETDYYYYALGKDGVHHYNKTL